jgi:poly(3-hydroxybutyrate) depolymerase
MGGAGAGGLGKGPSSACNSGVIAPDVLVDPVRHDMMVTVAAQYQPVYEPRYYFTNLPSTWDPATPYPVIMYGNGCGQTGPEGGPFAGTDDFIYVQLIPASVTAETVEPPGGSPGCFQAGRKGTADSPDGPYFDQVLAEVAATYCIDLDRIHVAGWSSGSWLSNWLACARGGVIRSTVAGSGGLYENHGTCQPGTAAMIFPGDAGSTQEDGFDIGAEYARDTLVMTNGCDTTPTAMAFGGANNCQYYGNCTLGAPVVYCTDGGGHGGPLGFMKEAGLAFWDSLP